MKMNNGKFMKGEKIPEIRFPFERGGRGEGEEIDITDVCTVLYQAEYHG